MGFETWQLLACPEANHAGTECKVTVCCSAPEQETASSHSAPKTGVAIVMRTFHPKVALHLIRPSAVAMQRHRALSAKNLSKQPGSYCVINSD